MYTNVYSQSTSDPMKDKTFSSNFPDVNQTSTVQNNDNQDDQNQDCDTTMITKIMTELLSDDE